MISLRYLYLLLGDHKSIEKSSITNCANAASLKAPWHVNHSFRERSFFYETVLAVPVTTKIAVLPFIFLQRLFTEPTKRLLLGVVRLNFVRQQKYRAVFFDSELFFPNPKAVQILRCLIYQLLNSINFVYQNQRVVSLKIRTTSWVISRLFRATWEGIRAIIALSLAVL